ncbi:Sec23/Sec24 trunk domain-containing protein [Umbelopsis sp. AD052]|nr:Sec23/Sec24 trunk domain-containing protein [Umbelopsis sp. AD052]
MQIDPNGNRSPGPRPPMGYRPTGTPPPNPAFRPAGTPPPPGSPMRPQFPPNQQGFQPPPPRPSSGQNGYTGIPPNAAGVRPPFSPGMRPPMPHDRSASPQTVRPHQQGSQLPPQSPVAQAASPPANLAPTPSYSSASLPDGPQSPTSSHMSQAEHQRRKRMYPQQITQAYLDQPSPAQSYDQQYQAPSNPAASSGQYFVPGSQPGQQGAPAPSTPGYGQQQPSQPGQQQPYQAQAPVANMTNQFSNMGFAGGPQPTGQIQSVSLMGVPPQIQDLYSPPPAINLPPNASITSSPTANSDPSYQRSTMNAIPATEALLKKSRLPLALVIAPYRTLKEGDEPVPVVSDTVIARCRRCRTYINPFVTFVEGGQRWKCNMCFLLNEVPSAFDRDAITSQPADRWKRAELNHGCVEFVAPTEYMVRPPQPPAYVFVIDVSYSAVQSGMVATAARTILDSLDRIPNEENRTKVAFITVDSSLHFYNFNSSLTEPQMLLVSEIDDVFLPAPTDLLVNLTESRHVIESFLEKLPDMFKDTTNIKNAAGSALQAAFKLVSVCGGKIICLQSTLPNVGTGALKPREDVKLLGTAKETTLLNAASPFYKTFAVDCSRSQVACDMLIFGGQYSDVATLSCLPRYTAGQTYFYPGFNAARTEDALKFAHEFSELLAEQVGMEAVIRIRASKGIRMTSYHGNFFVRSTDLLALPNVPRDQSYCVEIGIEDDLKTPTVCFQTALLHSTCHGERRIRVLTTCLPVKNVMAELYSSVDQFAMATFLANKAVERALTTKLDDARDAIVNKVVDMLGVYKTHILGSGSGSTPQLTISDNLKLLPALTLGLLKHDGLRQSSQIPTDLRSNAMNLLKTMPVQLLIPYIYPTLYSLHNMPNEAGEVGENGVVLPPRLNLSGEKLEPHGCYLLENGQNIYIWVGRGVVPQLCLDLFDVKSYEGLRGGKITLPNLENPFNQKVNMIIGKIREMRRGNYYPQLYLVKEDGEPALRLWFLSHLIEDRTDNVLSYPQLLQLLKDRVSSGSF